MCMFAFIITRKFNTNGADSMSWTVIKHSIIAHIITHRPQARRHWSSSWSSSGSDAPGPQLFRYRLRLNYPQVQHELCGCACLLWYLPASSTRTVRIAWAEQHSNIASLHILSHTDPRQADIGFQLVFEWFRYARTSASQSLKWLCMRPTSSTRTAWND